jgi:hypothetical protein
MNELEPDLARDFVTLKVIRSNRQGRLLVCDGVFHFLYWRDSGNLHTQFQRRCSCAGIKQGANRG